MQRKTATYYFSFAENNNLIFFLADSILLTSSKFYILLVATKCPRFSVPVTDEDQPRENVSIFKCYLAQSHIPVPGPASPGEDLQNTTDTTGFEYCLQTRCIVWFQKISIPPPPPHGWSLEIPKGWGGLKRRNFWGVWGDAHEKNFPRGCKRRERSHESYLSICGLFWFVLQHKSEIDALSRKNLKM